MKRSADIKYWLIAFSALNLVFLPYQLDFFIGNHDWDWVKGTNQILQWDTGLFEGRYAKFILNTLLFGGQILPLVNTLTSFALLALGVVWLNKYWRGGEGVAGLLIILLPVLMPFILGWLYFSINIIGNFAAVALGTGGLLLAEKDGVKAKSGAIVCFLAAFGVYPSVIEMLVECICFRYILKPPAEIKEMRGTLGCIGLSVLIFKGILIALSLNGYLYEAHYNLQTVSIREFLSRLPEVVNLCGRQLLTTIPFMESGLKNTGVILVIGAVWLSCRQNGLKNLLLWVMAIGATSLSAGLSVNMEEVAFMPRVNFYGLNFLYVGAAAVWLTSQKIWRNCGLLLSGTMLWYAVNSDYAAQKAWIFGARAETLLMERISSRIEEKTDVKPLTPIMAGEISLRRRHYNGQYELSSPYVLAKPFVVRHIPSGMYNFYAASPLFTANAQITTLTPVLAEYLRAEAEVWPTEKSLYVGDGYAVMILTKEGLRAIQAQLPR